HRGNAIRSEQTKRHSRGFSQPVGQYQEPQGDDCHGPAPPRIRHRKSRTGSVLVACNNEIRPGGCEGTVVAVSSGAARRVSQGNHINVHMRRITWTSAVRALALSLGMPAIADDTELMLSSP